MLKKQTMNKQDDRPNLVLTRAGAKSLHPRWKDDCNPERNFDIIALSYEQEENTYPENSHDALYYAPGSKVKGYYDWIKSNRSIFSDYEYIALIDDDVITTHADLNRLFQYCKTLNLQLAQPALTQDSYYSLLITRQHKSFLHRWTNWVEIMAPIFSANLLEKCLETFPLNFYGGGSLESLWPRLCKRMIGSVAIIDKIPIQHTREVGSAGSGTAGNNSTRFKNHLRRIVELQNAFYPTFDNICGLTKDGTFRHLGEHEMLQLLAYDIDAPGLGKHTKLDYDGGHVSTNMLCLKYLASARKNFEAVNGCEPNEQFNNDLMLAAIQAGATYEALLAI